MGCLAHVPIGDPLGVALGQLGQHVAGAVHVAEVEGEHVGAGVLDHRLHAAPDVLGPAVYQQPDAGGDAPGLHTLPFQGHALVVQAVGGQRGVPSALGVQHPVVQVTVPAGVSREAQLGRGVRARARPRGAGPRAPRAPSGPLGSGRADPRRPHRHGSVLRAGLTGAARRVAAGAGRAGHLVDPCGFEVPRRLGVGHGGDGDRSNGGPDLSHNITHTDTRYPRAVRDITGASLAHHWDITGASGEREPGVR